jgi:hypothetical protein
MSLRTDYGCLGLLGRERLWEKTKARDGALSEVCGFGLLGEEFLTPFELNKIETHGKKN